MSDPRYGNSSTAKTKHMVTGKMVEECDHEPLVMEGGQIEAKDFIL